MTVEDPIEYYIDGIGQTQVNTKVEMTFARGLRAILRQDPDVVMVGEIRDLETAQIAVQASLTGHLVLSTLHTNTAVGAVTRLRDMGIEPFLLSSSLIGVVAQRLVRVLNPATRVARTAIRLRAAPAERAARRRRRRSIWQPGRDSGSGYRGRMGIYELVLVDDHLRTMIHDGAAEHDLERYARTLTPSIRDDGRAKMLARQHHARGSAARDARGLKRHAADGRIRIHGTGRRRQGTPRCAGRRHRPPCARPAARAAAAAGHGHRGRARRKRPAAKRFCIGTGVSATDLSLLTRQLATLARAGLPLEETLLAVSQQSEKARVQTVLLGVRAKVMEGHTLADALGEFPRVFPEIYRATVVGRRTGRATWTRCWNAWPTTPRTAKSSARRCWAPCSTPSR